MSSIQSRAGAGAEANMDLRIILFLMHLNLGKDGKTSTISKFTMGDEEITRVLQISYKCITH